MDANKQDIMQANGYPAFIADESADASRDLVKLVRKLRWIGKEDEARAAERRLGATLSGDCVLAVPLETD